MRVIFFHYSMQSGGTERSIAVLSDYLVKKNVEVCVCVMDDRVPFYELNKQVKMVKLSCATNSKTLLEAVINNCSSVLKMRKVLDNIKPDIVVCFGANCVLQTFLAKINKKIKIIGTERANPYNYKNGFWKNNKKGIARLCDGFIFQTIGAKKYYSKYVQENSIIIQNGIDSAKFFETDKVWKQRKDICAVGRLDGDKCFQDLLNAFKIVHLIHPKIRLDIYGDGPLRAELDLLKKKLGLEETVTFHGNNKNILKEYASHKMFVSTSRSEGFSNVLLEAMASGCACVVTDCEFSPSEIICDGLNGFLVPVHDVDTIAKRICQLIENDCFAKKISSNATKIREKNNIEKIGDQFYKYLEYILNAVR